MTPSPGSAHGAQAGPTRIFFILALGRSGTNFLASLLARDRRGCVHHEPYPLDRTLMLLRHAGGCDRAVDQLLEARFEGLLQRAGAMEFYGEVNSYLRYEADWLRRRFDPLLIHLVRDGRDFVRSAWVRGVYTPQETDGPILPRDEDPYAERWSALSRFQRLCWYWTHTNEHLAARIEHRVRFERILGDYPYLKSRVLDPIGARIPEELWRREVGRPRNTSRGYRLRAAAFRLLRGRDRLQRFDPLPHWSKWDAQRSREFWEICGPAMRRFGYGD